VYVAEHQSIDRFVPYILDEATVEFRIFAQARKAEALSAEKVG
jgi:hypothetical protein